LSSVDGVKKEISIRHRSIRFCRRINFIINVYAQYKNGNERYLNYFEKNTKTIFDHKVKTSHICETISSDLIGNITIDSIPFHTSFYY
jgi:hypothetical protein